MAQAVRDGGILRWERGGVNREAALGSSERVVDGASGFYMDGQDKRDGAVC